MCTSASQVRRFLLFCLATASLGGVARADHPLAAERVTSLTNSQVKYARAARSYAILRRGGVEAVVVDNAAVDIPECPGHRAGYNGLASMRLAEPAGNLFVGSYAGLNFEHIHDGSAASVRAEKFEPRKAEMQLRVIDEHTVELYQPPTPGMRLESCGRYRLLEDGVVEYVFECIPREKTWRNGYLALFWASYIARPESTDIHFIGRPSAAPDGGEWIRAASPQHGVDSTHPPAGPLPDLPHDDDFPLTLVFHRSKHVVVEPWYYGESRGRAFVQMFRSRDRIWPAQSPSGGGPGNPAWDFQWFIPNPQVGEAYGFTMRAALLPATRREELERNTRSHREQLNRTR